MGNEVVAAGRPEELERPRGVEVETEEGVAVHEGLRRDDVPALVARLTAEGHQVYGVRVLRSSLEEIYLEAVGGETS